MGNPLTFEKQAVINNIASTKIFKIIWNSENLNNLAESKITTEDHFVTALMKFKKDNPDFGFPNLEELLSIMKNEIFHLCLTKSKNYSVRWDMAICLIKRLKI